MTGNRKVNLEALVAWLDAMVDDERVSASTFDVQMYAPYPHHWMDGSRLLARQDGPSDLTLTLHLIAESDEMGRPYDWPDLAPLLEDETDPPEDAPEPAKDDRAIHIHITGNTFVGSDPDAARKIGELAAQAIQERGGGQ